MIRRPPRSTRVRSSAASDVYKRQINACGHHHSGNIGILGVDKKGTELYQITLGGNPKDSASIGTIIGPGFRAESVPQAIDTIVDTYIENRHEGESFLETWRRVGAVPFKEALYT